MRRRGAQLVQERGRGFVQVRLAYHDQKRAAGGFELVHQPFLVFGPDVRLDQQHGHVHAAQRGEHLFAALVAQRGRVVHPAGVREDHGPDRQQFHRFLDGVRRRAGLRRDDGDVLPRQEVQEGGFADVGPAEEADVQAHGLGGLFFHSRPNLRLSSRIPSKMTVGLPRGEV